MQTMHLNFAIYTIIFWLGYMGFIKVLWAMLQVGGAFDGVSNGKWSLYMDKLFGGSARQQLLEKVLGGCEQCGSFWWAFPWTVAYFVFFKCAGLWCLNVVASIIWVFPFVSVCALLGLYILTRKKSS